MHIFETVVLPEVGAAVVETYRKRGLAAPMTRSHFTKFLAEHFFGKGWESPSDAELLDFTISGGRSI